jgi:hypothetical protein
MDPKSGVVEPSSEFLRVLGEAYLPGVVLSMYAAGGSTPPDTFTAPGAREPDFQKFVPTNVNFVPSVGGVQHIRTPTTYHIGRCM